MAITPQQSRAARGLLGWNQNILAEKAQIGVSTVRDFEGGTRVPIENNLNAIKHAFELAGIELINSTGVNKISSDDH